MIRLAHGRIHERPLGGVAPVDAHDPNKEELTTG